LEEELAELVGDEAAPRIANALRNIRNFAVDTLEDVAAQVSGYLQGDGNHFPTRVEIETFFNNVDELSNDLARIEARLSRIRKKPKKHDQDED
jgi:ubiquinone biosynthesis protein UbiJ